MADNNKGKTKAAILQELESIKGLLHDEDHIPILQEVIAGEANKQQATLSNRPMAKQDLDALHNAFEALSRNINSNPSKKDPPSKHNKPANEGLTNLAVQQPMRESNATQQIMQQAKQTAAAMQQSALAKQQPSLFGTENLNQNYLQEDLVDIEPTKSTELPSVMRAEKILTDNPGTNRDHSEVADYPMNKPITPQMNRPSLAKASGENPFLPQHIRARLHGNNPPPLFDEPFTPLTPQPSPSHILKAGDESLPDRRHLIQDVIASLLPQIQQELCQRLQNMTEDQLIHLLNQEE